MERRSGLPLRMIGAVALVLALAQPALGYEPPDAETNPGGVRIVFEWRGNEIVGRSEGGGGGCAYRADPYSDSLHGPIVPAYGEAPSPRHFLFVIYCDAQIVDTRWLGPADFVDGFARGLAERVVREFPVDGIGVAVRPATRGITGIPSLFWVDAYDGRPWSRRATELGVTVDVEVTLQEVVWSFGDGSASQAGGLGEAWPTMSSVRHVYEHSSAEGGFPVSAAITLAARWRVDGGAWAPLDPLARDATIAYDVRQLQAVRNR